MVLSNLILSGDHSGSTEAIELPQQQLGREIKSKKTKGEVMKPSMNSVKLHRKSRMYKIIKLSIISLLTASTTMAQDIVLTSPDGKVTQVFIDNSTGEPDYLNAVPMEIPRITKEEFERFRSLPNPPPVVEREPSSSRSFSGTGRTWEGLSRQVYDIAEWNVTHADEDVGNDAFGSRGPLPYSTTLVEIPGRSTEDGEAIDLSRVFPYRTAGKLFFDTIFGSATCSAVMVGKGILLTAAHCVVDNAALGVFFQEVVHQGVL